MKIKEWMFTVRYLQTADGTQIPGKIKVEDADGGREYYFQSTEGDKIRIYQQGPNRVALSRRRRCLIQKLRLIKRS